MRQQERNDARLERDEHKLEQAINLTNTYQGYPWSPSEVREVAELGLGYIRYIQKLRRQGEKAKKHICKCGKPAVVGWGKPPEWVCQDCFEDNLKGVSKVIDQAMKLVGR